jgi:hypothetical protein
MNNGQTSYSITLFVSFALAFARAWFFLKKGDRLGLLLDVPTPFKEEHKLDLSFLNARLAKK